jgi:hypothetical protein
MANVFAEQGREFVSLLHWNPGLEVEPNPSIAPGQLQRLVLWADEDPERPILVVGSLKMALGFTE